MNLIRSIKINKLGIKISEKKMKIINFVNSMLSDLIPFKDDDYPMSIFYFKGDKWILELDNKNYILWVRYDIFWSVLEEKYKIKYSDVQTLLKYMIEQTFKEKVLTSIVRKTSNPIDVEKAFKKVASSRVASSIGADTVNIFDVECAFNKNISDSKK